MNSLKPSLYNLVVDTLDDGRKLMFNTLTSAFCLVDETVKSLIEKQHSEADAYPEEPKKVVEQLHSLGFLVNQDIDERELLEFRRNTIRFNNQWLCVTIGPTLSCNMRCPYCYEAEQNQSMSSETAEKLISFIRNQITTQNITRVKIAWYGGEPLLEMERIKQISNGVIPFCDERGVQYYADITTNGYLLTEENAKILKELRVGDAQITIDGLEKTHNARRKLKSGKGSFWPIVNNVQLAKDYLHIIIRVNVDKTNIDEVDELTDFFIDELGWGNNVDFYLAPVDKTTDACQAEVDNCLDPESFSLLDQQITEKMFNRGISTVVERDYPRFREVGCAAICRNYYVVDAQGFIYTCWNHFGNQSKTVGNLDEPEKILSSGRYYSWMNVPVADKCKECVYLPLCQGGCPDQRVNNQGVPVCSFYPLRYINNLKLNYTSYAQKKSEEAKERP